MLSFTIALFASLCAPIACPATVVAHAAHVGASDSLRATFEGGQTWTDFYASVDRRRDVWEGSWTKTQIPDALLGRASAAGKLRILVITEYGCSDSANSVPALARIVSGRPEKVSNTATRSRSLERIVWQSVSDAAAESMPI